VINYKQEDVVREVRKIAPNGVDAVVEVAVAQNAATDAEVLAQHGAVAIYAGTPDQSFTAPVRSQMQLNARWQFVMVYSEPARAKDLAVGDINTAVADGAVRVGDDVGLPLHVFPLAQTADAHRAVQDGVTGKVLVDVSA
jgi:NADPH2:quinone reductase